MKKINASLAVASLGWACIANAATFIVDDPLDIPGFGTTLRDAINASNASSEVDQIIFNLPTDSVITLRSELPAISGGVSIEGSAAGNISISGDDQFRIFSIDTEADEAVLIRDLVLTNGAAQGADGGALLIADEETVTLQGITITSSVAGGSGGGIYLGAATLVTDSVTFTGNESQGPDAEQGGGGLYSLGGVVTATNTIFDANRAAGISGSGGGIYANGGVVDLNSCRLIRNTATRAGGGIELASSSAAMDATLLNTIVEDNAATGTPGNGGGLHVTAPLGGETTDIDITSGSINNNTAETDGGGLWVDRLGSLSVEFTSTFGNVAGGAESHNGGGGVFNNGGAVTIVDANIDSNAATGDMGSGGAIFANGGTTNLLGGSLAYNVASSAGGGIEVSSTDNGPTTVLLTNIVIIENQAGPNPGNGGGVHLSESADEITVTISGGTVDGNVADAEGGGVWIATGNTLIVENATLVDNVASGDASNQGGGGLFNDGGNATLTQTILLTNVADGSAGSGGGILTNGGDLSLLQVRLERNTAQRAGGGMEITTDGGRDAHVQIDTSDFSLNSAGPAPGNGGGLHVTDPTGGPSSQVVIDDTSFLGNSASEEGGGIWNDMGGAITIRASQILANTAAAANAALDVQGGGGIFNNGGRVEITDGASLNNNQVTGPTEIDDGGGAILNRGGGNVTIRDSSIQGNTASAGLGSGGGVLNAATGMLRASNITIDNNSAARAGGAIANAGTAFLAGITASANSAGVNGGMLALSGQGLVSVVDSRIDANTATAEGGGIWVSGDGVLDLEISSITDNSALSGGGIFVDGDGSGTGNLSITQSAIVRNEARSRGGALMLESGLTQVVDSTISNNSAIDGAGIFTEAAEVSLSFTTVAENAASGLGGGIHNLGTALVVADNSIIGSNSAGEEGPDVRGGLMVDGFVILSNFSGTGIMGDFSNSQLNTDPLLAPLADNGGRTLSHLLLPGSPAIDAAGSERCNSLDQRLFPRIDGACDIGAVEIGGTQPDRLLRDSFEF